MALNRLQGSVAWCIYTDLLFLISLNHFPDIVFNQIHSASGGSIQLVIEPPLAFYKIVKVVLLFMAGVTGGDRRGYKVGISTLDSKISEVIRSVRGL